MSGPHEPGDDLDVGCLREEIDERRAVVVVAGLTKQLRVAPEELYAEMHKAGLARLSQVEFAILETDGKIAFLPSDSQGGAHEQ